MVAHVQLLPASCAVVVPLPMSTLMCVASPPLCVEASKPALAMSLNSPVTSSLRCAAMS